MTFTGLTDGSSYWFKVVALDNLGDHIVSSEPVAVMPGARTEPISSLAITPWGRMSWLPSSDSLGYMEKLGLEAAEARIVAVSSLTSQPMGISGPPDGSIFDAEFSPDGTRLAYTHTPSLTSGLIDYRVWIASREDGSENPVTEGRVDFDGTWASPEHLYYCRGTYEPPNIYQIWSLNLAMGEAKAVTTDPELRKFHPSVRPSDQLIVFEGQDTATSDHSLYLLNPVSGSRLALTAEPWCSDSAPSWTPGGNKVIFVSDRSGHPEIWAIDVTSRSMLQLTRGQRGSAKQYARLSPDGRLLAVVDGVSWPGHPAQLQFYAGPFGPL